MNEALSKMLLASPAKVKLLYDNDQQWWYTIDDGPREGPFASAKSALDFAVSDKRIAYSDRGKALVTTELVDV